jgi:hypothetical protein
MQKKKFIRLVHNRVAELAIGPSALRNQGDKHVVSKARSFLKSLEISKFAPSSESRFLQQLDLKTKSLMKRLPKRARHFGAARKALNLFLRDVLYNTYLRRYYHFEKATEFLEVPLDSYVVKGIRGDNGNVPPGKWKNIKSLDPIVSECYQSVTKRIANKKGIARLHLDNQYWRASRKKRA